MAALRRGNVDPSGADPSGQVPGAAAWARASFQSVEGLDGPWSGLPAIGVFDDAGRPVPFAPTWDEAKGATVDHIDGERPEAFAAALDKAYEAVRARTAGGGGGGAGGGSPGMGREGR